MFNSSTYKVILHLEKDGVEDLKKLTTLTSGEVELIERFKVGEAILVAGSKRIQNNSYHPDTNSMNIEV